VTSNQPQRLRVTLAAWAPFIGGAEIALERLACGLVEAGHDVLVIVGTNGPALELFLRAGLRVRHIKQRFTSKLGWLRYRSSVGAMVRILREERPDILHSNDLPTHQLASDAARRLIIPRVCHHRWVFDGKAVDWLNKYGAERHLFVSDYLMNEICRASPRLAAAPRAVVYDGLSIPSAPTIAEKVASRRLLNLCEDRTVVLFAGQVIERKGVEDILRAWSLLAAEWKDSAQLVIVGDDLEGKGSYRRKMEALAARLQVPVDFVGFQKEVSRWLNAAEIVLVPSHVEPLGNAILEAMAHALPVIATHVGGIPEMVVHERTGLLVPPHAPEQLAAAIHRLLCDAEQRSALGAAARHRCEKLFSLTTHVAAMTQQYLSVVRQFAKAPS
jgi:glycosyltransferase involved in cell wall biosynthesis